MKTIFWELFLDRLTILLESLYYVNNDYSCRVDIEHHVDILVEICY